MSTPTPQTHGLGAHRAAPDGRDVPLALARLPIQTLPPSVDLRANLPPIWDQGQTNACTAYASLAGLALQQRKQKRTVLEQPSHTFTYYFTRKREGTQNTDGGANIRDAMKSLANEGACGVKDWPDGNQFINLDPAGQWQQVRFETPPRIYGYDIPQDPTYVAAHHRLITYRAVPLSGDAVRLSVANGFGVVFGVELFSSWWATGGDGMVPSPDTVTERLVGGHAMLICGYRTDGRFICRNSWSLQWGDAGYCYLPANWFDGGAPCWDLWTAHSVT